MEEGTGKILVGVSSCLLGEKVRFDSGHKKNDFITNILQDYFEFHPFCPEVSIGLGIPRETIRLVWQDEKVRCVGTKSVDLDVTDKLKTCAEDQKSWHQDLCAYILKKDSPSCGMERVKVYKGDMPKREGVGVYAEGLLKNFPNLPVEEEGRLQDPVLRENFVQRVFIYSRWRSMLKSPVSIKHINEFHAQHKYIFMSHDQNQAKALGSWLADHFDADMTVLTDGYLEKMMQLLKVTATAKNHANTLQHLQGYLKTSITQDDKQELVETIRDYREGLLPLIVPITLLRHHFRRFPHPYITTSFYMNPHPSQLMLLNGL
jgi:uncharacterized protein YbgA (DUF1722 family)/uncharacterized protein YbbK (DUF523 family)